VVAKTKRVKTVAAILMGDAPVAGKDTPDTAALAKRDLPEHTLVEFPTLRGYWEDGTMSDRLARLFHEYDRGRISRRQLLQALGIAVAVRPISALAFGQGAGQDPAGARGQGQRQGAPADTTPAKLPFEPTGWTTVLLDHFSAQAVDYQKEAAFYAALMGWKIRSDDGKQAVLDIGDWGGFVLRGGYQPPPAPPPPPAPTPAAAGADPNAAGRGQRGGGRGPTPPRQVLIDNFCWGIEPWDAKKVEADLKKRGLNPVADNDSKNNFQSFHVKDPDGFDLQISNGNMKNRRKSAANGKTSAPAPFDNTNWKTVWLDHISFQCSNYKESVAFYNALLGWKLGKDTGRQNQCEIGDVGGIIIRAGGGGRGADPNAPPPPRHATIDHISFGIQPWDPDAVKAELDKRGLRAQIDTGGGGDIHTAAFQSYHTTTPEGFDLQISFVTKANRNAGSGAPGEDE
jgi:catechol 2,3-dioxygenase-like lactoylglutathione lyase family enzyme